MLRATWEPGALAGWTAAGGPLHDTGTLETLWDAGGHDDARGAVGLRAERLRAAGVGAGDVVSWQLPNCDAAIEWYRACWTLGAVAAPVHHLAGAAELATVRAALGPAVVVDTDDVVDATGATGGGATSPDPADVAVVLHTSGSSGTPKGVLHTHRALVHKARTMAGLHGLGQADTVLMPAPLAHVSGLLNGILVPAAAGMRCVLMERWDPEAALERIEAEQVTFMVGPPTFFVGLEGARGFSPERVASLRLLSVGGAGVTPEFVERTSEVFGAVVKRSYGSTEAPTVTTARRGDDVRTRAHTDGRPVPGARLRTVDVTTGDDVGTGRPGEVWVSGPELFAGYLDPSANAGACEGDWFRTGDVGVLDDEGRLIVTGRIKDVIIRGGENISAAEVEAHLEAHPRVRHAVVVGVPDTRLGEVVCAVVELDDGDRPPEFDLAEVRDWFAARGVTRFRTPESVVVVERVPLLASGKADRAAARRLASSAG